MPHVRPAPPARDARPPETLPPEAAWGYLATGAGFSFGLLLVAAVVALAASLGGCAATRAQPPPYGILTYDHTHHETVDAGGRVVARDCHTHAEGGLEAATAALQGQSCGDTIGTSASGIEAFEGQAIGAPIYLAKVKADAARDQALIKGGYQLGGLAACAGMIAATGATAGAALPAAAAACLQAVKGAAPVAAPPQEPPPPGPSPAATSRDAGPRPPSPPVPAPYRPGLFSPGPHGDARRPGHVRVLLGYDPAAGLVRYLDPDGRPARLPAAEWARRVL